MAAAGVAVAAAGVAVAAARVATLRTTIDENHEGNGVIVNSKLCKILFNSAKLILGTRFRNSIFDIFHENCDKINHRL